MSKASVLGLLVLLATACAPALGAGQSSLRASEGLPESLMVYIREKLPDRVLLERDRAIAPVVQFLASRPIKQPSPFVCSGDFDGNGLTDLALLLRSSATGTLALVAFHQVARGVYAHITVADLPGISVRSADKIGLFVTCERPGKKRGVEGAVVYLKWAGVTLETWEKAAELFYFENGSYKSLVIGD